MVSSGEGDVIFQEACKFPSESGGELGASVRDDPVVKTKSEKDVLEKYVSNVSGRGSFVARAQNYPF